MSKRTIWQCDKCLKTAEQDEIPGDWVSVTAGSKTMPNRYFMWCAPCYRQIKEPIPQEPKR